MQLQSKRLTKAERHRQQTYGVAAVLVGLVALSQYRLIQQITGVSLPGFSGVSVTVPAGPSGKTVYPLRDLVLPNATAYCDPQYYKGYPNSAGTLTYPTCAGYWHTGVDMNGPTSVALGGNADQGDPVHAVRDGTILFSGDGGGSWGPIVRQEVTVDGQKYWVEYCHVQNHGKDGTITNVKAGQVVKCGDVLAYVGRGNPANPWKWAHLHLTIFKVKVGVGWWPTRYGKVEQVTAVTTEPMAWFNALGAVRP